MTPFLRKKVEPELMDEAWLQVRESVSSTPTAESGGPLIVRSTAYHTQSKDNITSKLKPKSKDLGLFFLNSVRWEEEGSPDSCRTERVKVLEKE